VQILSSQLLNRSLRAAAALWRTVAAAALIACVISGLFFALNAVSVGYNVSKAQAQVRQAFARHQLQDVSWLPGNTGIGTHQFNDCLILLQAVDQRADPWALRISPLNQSFPARADPCIYLHHFNASAPLTQPYFYHRYLHGHTMLIRWLLPNLSVGAIRLIYQTVIIGGLLAGFAIALIQIAKGHDRTRGVAWAILFAVFTRYFGIESYGQSLGHGPADLIAVLFLLFLCLRWSRGGLSLGHVIPAAAIFGTLTMIFEFLTGGIPLGASIVIGALPLALPEGNRSIMCRATIQALLAYCSAIVVTILAKAALLIATFGYAPLAEAKAQLAVRMTHGAVGETADASVSAFWTCITQGLDSLASGMGFLAMGMLAISATAGYWGYRTLIAAPDQRWTIEARLLALSTLPPILWLPLFWQHTIVHARFMDRILVWLIVAPFILFTLAAANLSRSEGKADA
jgi:hypothetical protein